MHRIHRVKPWAFAGVLAIAFAAVHVAVAQENVPPPAPTTGQAKSLANAIILPLEVSKRVEMKPKRAIRSATIEKESIARVQSIQDDPQAVLITGLQVGSTKLRLVDTQGVEQEIDVMVELDLGRVKEVIAQAFPTATVDVRALGAMATSKSVVLTGNVPHAEEIEAILRVAQAVLNASGAGGGSITVVNGMTVGGVRQVQLDVTIAAVSRSELRNFGVNFTVNGTSAFGGSLIGSLTQAGQSVGGAGSGGGGTGGGGLGGLGGIGLANTNSVLLGPQQFLNALTPGPRTNLVFGIVPAQLNAFIQALREERLAKLLAEPRLVTLSGRRAFFNSGGQQALPVVSGGSGGGGVNAVGSELIPFGTQLEFLPIVLGNGKIVLDVNTAVSSLNAANGFVNAGIVVQGRDEQRVQTVVMMEPGQTFAIGGLIQNEVSGNTLKTPILGDLPFLGPLFSNIAYSENERELVILVTPYLVDPMDCKQAPCKLPGMETRTPDDFELFLELILEAPRGQREVFPNKKYKPAWMNDSTADKFPCGGGYCPTSCTSGKCGKCAKCQSGCSAGCGTAGCAGSGGIVPASNAAPAQNAPTAPAGSVAAPAADDVPLVLPVTTTTQYPPPPSQ